MTGKQFKNAVALIPDDAEVDIQIVEKKEGSFYPSNIIKGMTVQNITKFSPTPIFRDNRISIVCFEVNGDKNERS